LCEQLKEAGHEPELQERTGLLLDPYFSGSKIAWALDHWPQLKAAGDRLALGTVESWLVWKLTGGLHVTDATNAARTALMDITKGLWDAGCSTCSTCPLPRSRRSSTAPAASARRCPICSARRSRSPASPATSRPPRSARPAFAPARPRRPTAPAPSSSPTPARTRSVAAPPAHHRRLAAGRRAAYALEGSVFVAGSLIKWLRDSLGLIVSAAESEQLARSVGDSGGAVIVPALTGLGAPHWQPDARAAITGLTFATGRAQIVRAALEAMAHQTTT
jgi:glycerol kinase